jgi:hypothetical protein
MNDLTSVGIEPPFALLVSLICIAGARLQLAETGVLVRCTRPRALRAIARSMSYLAGTYAPKLIQVGAYWVHDRF